MALGLRGRDWSVLNLGQDTPPEAIERSARRVDARLVVVAAATSPPLGRLAALSPPLGRLAALELPDGATLAIGGAGADERAATRLGARLLDTDPLTAAELLELLSSDLR